MGGCVWVLYKYYAVYICVHVFTCVCVGGSQRLTLGIISLLAVLLVFVYLWVCVCMFVHVIKLFFFNFVLVYVSACTCHGTHLEVKEQLLGVTSLPLCRSCRSYSDHQAWWQALMCWPSSPTLFLRQSFSLGSGAHWKDHWAPQIHVFPPPQHWSYKCMLPHPAFYVGTGKQLRSLCLND